MLYSASTPLSSAPTMQYSASTLVSTVFTAGPLGPYGLLRCMLQAHIYMMRLLCYDSYSHCEATKDQLFLCSYGISCMPLGIRYYIREDRLSLALLADPLMEYRPRFDLYI